MTFSWFSIFPHTRSKNSIEWTLRSQSELETESRESVNDEEDFAVGDLARHHLCVLLLRSSLGPRVTIF